MKKGIKIIGSNITIIKIKSVPEIIMYMYVTRSRRALIICRVTYM